MGITNVIRGEDHLSNTPKQVLIFNAINKEIPTFTHVSMILGKDKAKLSKRHGAESIKNFKESGYMAIGIINYLARLGWSHGNQEIFNLDEMINLFSLDNLSKSPAIFDTEKLTSLNGVHIRSMDNETLIKLAQDTLPKEPDNKNKLNNKKLSKIIPLIKERIKSIDEIYPSIKFFFIYTKPKKSIIKCGALDDNEVKEILNKLVTDLNALLEKDNKTHADIEKLLRDNCENLGLKLRDYLGLVRNCITGAEVSPPLFESIEISEI